MDGNQYLPLGYLKIQASMGQDTLPVQGAHVVVRGRDGLITQVYFEGDTDEDGILDGISLPAPLAGFSSFPQALVSPSRSYEASVSHPDFQQVFIQSIPIFSGIKSIQPVNMIPLTKREGA